MSFVVGLSDGCRQWDPNKDNFGLRMTHNCLPVFGYHLTIGPKVYTSGNLDYGHSVNKNIWLTGFVIACIKWLFTLGWPVDV